MINKVSYYYQDIIYMNHELPMILYYFDRSGGDSTSTGSLGGLTLSDEDNKALINAIYTPYSVNAIYVDDDGIYTIQDKSKLYFRSGNISKDFSENEGSTASHVLIAENLRRLNWNCIAKGLGKTIITANDSSMVAVLNDGENEFQYTGGMLAGIRKTIFVEKVFISISSLVTDKISYSYDGINWFEKTMDNTCGRLNIEYDIDEGIITITTNTAKQEIMQLDDIITWEEGELSSSTNWVSVCYGEGKYVAVAASTASAAYSTDGINWTSASLPASRDWKAVCYGNNVFVAIAYNSKYIAYSTDGITWIQKYFTIASYWNSICYGAGDSKFVAIASNNTNKVQYSANGKTWTAKTLPSTSNWSSIAYGNGRFVTVATNTKKVAYSDDGLTWVAKTLPSSQAWSSIAYGDGKFVAVGGRVGAYSTNGLTWTACSLADPSDINWSRVIYGEDRFIAVASQTVRHKYAYSFDGINWESADLPIDAMWDSICYNSDDESYVATAYSSNKSLVGVKDFII